ncbi:MAG: cell division/cell wall cluster transcriptional repressor MraZ [Burkholderiaceae bacterium]
MFYQGSHKAMLDAKSRIAVPNDFRVALGKQCQGELTLTRGGGEHCLWLFPRPVWLKFRQNLRNLRGRDLAYRSHFLQNARDLEIDKGGRINIPSSLRELAGFDSPAVYFAGDGDYFELWDWDRKMASTREIDFTAMPDSLFDYDIQASDADGAGSSHDD